MQHVGREGLGDAGQLPSRHHILTSHNALRTCKMPVRGQASSIRASTVSFHRSVCAQCVALRWVVGLVPGGPSPPSCEPRVREQQLFRSQGACSAIILASGMQQRRGQERAGRLHRVRLGVSSRLVSRCAQNQSLGLKSLAFIPCVPCDGDARQRAACNAPPASGGLLLLSQPPHQRGSLLLRPHERPLCARALRVCVGVGVAQRSLLGLQCLPPRRVQSRQLLRVGGDGRLRLGLLLAQPQAGPPALRRGRRLGVPAQLCSSAGSDSSRYEARGCRTVGEGSEPA